MDSIIKNLIKEIGYGVKLKNLCKYDIITIVAVTFGIGFAIAFYVLRDMPLLIISIIAIAIAQVSTGCLNASHHEGLKTQNNIHQRLKVVEHALHNHKMLSIKNHKDMVVFTKKLKEYYDSKFTALKVIKKAIDDITKILLIPTILALISYVLKDDNEYADMESKLIFIFVFIFFILWLIVMYNMFFELVRSIIKIINVKMWVFITDLNLLSSFEIKDLDEESVEETKFIFLEREGEKMNSYNNSQFEKMVKKYCEEYGETEINNWSDYYNKMLETLSNLKDEGKLMEEKAKTETILEYCNQYSNNENIKTSISVASVAFSVMAVIINSFAQYQTESKMKLIFLIITFSILGISCTVIMSFISSRKLKADAVYYKSKLDLIKEIE